MFLNTIGTKLAGFGDKLSGFRDKISNLKSNNPLLSFFKDKFNTTNKSKCNATGGINQSCPKIIDRNNRINSALPMSNLDEIRNTQLPATPSRFNIPARIPFSENIIPEETNLGMIGKTPAPFIQNKIPNRFGSF